MRMVMVHILAWLSVALSTLALVSQYWWYSQAWLGEQEPTIHGKMQMILYFAVFFGGPTVSFVIGVAALAIASDDKPSNLNYQVGKWTARTGILLSILGFLLCIPMFLLGFRGVEIGKGVWT